MTMSKPTAKRGRGRPKGSRNKPKPKSAPAPVERIGMRPAEFAKAMGVSISSVHAAIKRGDVDSELFGRCRIIYPKRI
jgi:hypothetical protein